MRTSVVVLLVLVTLFACQVDAKKSDRDHKHHADVTIPVANKMDPNVTIPCLFCEAVVAGIAVTVQSGNYTLQLLEEVAQTLCNIIGGAWIGAECQTIIGDIQQIVNWIDSKMPTVTICENLGLCTDYMNQYAMIDIDKKHPHQHHSKHHHKKH